MIDLKIYGKPSSTYEYLKAVITEKSKEAGVNINIVEESATSEFIKESIQRIPAFKIGNEIISNPNGDIAKFGHELTQWILSKENYGTMKKIIVPTDFSECADNALSYALNMSTDVRSVVKVIHAYHPTPTLYDGTPIRELQLEKIHKIRLNELILDQKEKLIQLGKSFPMIEGDLVIGLAGDEIIKMSETEKDSIIIIGTTGVTNALKNVLGSVSQKVAKHARSPVILVPKDREYQRLNNIVYCTSDTQRDASVTMAVLEMARRYEANIHLLHFDDGYEINNYSTYQLWSKFYPQPKLIPKTISTGQPVEMLKKYIEENNIDLVALSTEDRGFWGELFHDSFSYKVIKHVNQPIMICHKYDEE